MTNQPELPNEEQTPETNLEFEQALEKLEAIVENMESGDLKLTDSLKQFEEGMKLAKFCTQKLGKAEKRIETLVAETGEQGEWAPFDTEATE